MPDIDSLEARCAAHAPVAEKGSFAVGTVFGDWRLTAFIGSGGNGEVYCSEHVTLGTSAAVKVLVREDERAKARFAREARLLSELKSASFPQFLGSGKANGCPYLVMELLEPGELPSGDGNVARFLRQVCDAVAELHARGIVHRDIKPSNILWRTAAGRDYQARRIGRAGAPRTPFGCAAAVPVLADLGLVKAVATSYSGRPTLDITLGGVGTPGYGAPEQMERGEVSLAADIHALGVLADRCFRGNPPRTWARIIERATSSIPARRYPSVASFARAIRWRHSLGICMAAACIGVLAVAGIAAGRLLVSPEPSSFAVHPPAVETPGVMHGHAEGQVAQPGKEPPQEEAAPVLRASAMLDGAEAKDARWYLDDKKIEMPYRFAEADGWGKTHSYKWLRAVVNRNGKVYSAKEEGGVPAWKGERRLSLTLLEDPAVGTSVRIFSPGGVPFDFVWRRPREDDADAVGYGYWMSKQGLTGRQLGAIVQDGLLYTPFDATKRYDFTSDDSIKLEHAQSMSIPVFSFPDAGVVIGPLSAWQQEDASRRIGGADVGLRMAATSGFANETNTVLHCAALGLLRSGSPAEAAQGEEMLRSFLNSDDEEFAALAREICIERGVVSLESCGANPPPRFRRAAIRHGNGRMLEWLAAADPDSDIRAEAYERLRNPSQMLSARYIARIGSDFSGDIGEPVKVIENMTEREALEYLADNASLEYLRDLAKDRLSRVRK